MSKALPIASAQTRPIIDASYSPERQRDISLPGGFVGLGFAEAASMRNPRRFCLLVFVEPYGT
jgi:hypothetical protein